MSWPGVGGAFPALNQDYEFERLLGQGSTGWVVLARHRQLARLEAVKIIRGGSRQLPAVRRLEREGRVLARLDHPGIITVYRQLTSTMSLALAMEYLPGGDLQQAMDGGLLSGPDRIGILAQVAGALTAAASVGIVHRDVKPSNVLLDGVGRAVVADFGLARLPADTGVFRTMSGAVTGTPLFMAPEQIDHPENDAPSIDAYAFGVLAYRLLTGAWPYPAGSVADVMQAHRLLSPTPPWEHLRDLPRPAGVALLGALDKDPELRWRPDQLMQALLGVPGPQWDALVGSQSRPSGVVTQDRLRPPAHEAPGPVVGGPGTAAEDPPALTGAESVDGVLEGPPMPGATADCPRIELSAAGSTLQPNPGAAAISPPIAEQDWLQPPVYKIPRRVSRRMLVMLVGALVGLLLGVIITIVLLITS